MTYPPAQGPPPRPTNSLAVASLVCAFVFAPLGIVFGHMSLSQIKRTGENGRGMALAGTILGYVITAVSILIVAVALVIVVNAEDDERNDASSSTSSSAPSTATRSPRTTARPTPPPPPDGVLPPFVPPAGLGENCTYPATADPAAKPVEPPRSGTVPTDPAVVSVSMVTSQGPLGLKLDNAMSPCTVNSFVSLAQQGYFDDTPCHRLTTSQSLSVLQCGDPTGTGSGGPGYQFDNEYPTSQYSTGDPASQEPVVYPRGTLAMANAGPGTNGSQFFMVYEDSLLPPQYTIFGTIDENLLPTLDTMVAAGVAGGGEDGPPANEVVITSVQLD